MMFNPFTMQAAAVEPIKKVNWRVTLFPSHRKVKLKDSMDEMPNAAFVKLRSKGDRSIHLCSTQAVNICWRDS